MSDASPLRVEEVDGLRAVAVLLVLSYHTSIDKFFQGGFIGVDIFFVISGYVVTRSIQKRLNSNSFSFLSFYKRRCFRLVPAYLTLINFTLPFCIFLFSKAHQKSTGNLAMCSLIFTSNICLWMESGYFDLESKLKPLLHTWSLGVEWQFYLSWPFLLFAAQKMGVPAKLKAIIFSAIGLVSLAFAQYYLKRNSELVFYNTPFRYYEFIIGAVPVLYDSQSSPLEQNSNRRISYALQNILVIFSAIVITSFGLLFSDRVPFPGISALPICFCTILLILYAPGSAFGYVLRTKGFQHLGRISYSVYLVHWPLLVFLNYTDFSGTNTFGRIATAIFSIFIGDFLYKAVENSFQHEVSTIKKRTIIAFYVLIIFHCIILISDKINASYIIESLLNKDEAVDKEKLIENLISLRKGRKDLVRSGKCHLIRKFTYCSNSCNTTYEMAPFLECNPKKEKEILVLGDSHAADHWFGLSNLFSSNVSVIQMTMAACDPLQFSDKPECKKFYRMLPNLLKNRFEGIRAIIIAGWWRDKYVKQGTEKLEKLIAFLKDSTHAKIFLLGMRPVLSVDPVRILEGMKNTSIIKVIRRFEEETKHETEAERVFPALAMSQGITFLSVFDLMCSNYRNLLGEHLKCITIDENENIVIYADHHHYNKFGCIILVEKYKDRLLQALSS